MFKIATSVLAALTVAIAGPAMALGSDPAAILAGDANSVELAQPAIETAQTMSAEALEQTSGAQNTLIQAVTDQKLIAANSNNSVMAGDNITFGDVSFGDNAFTGFNGLGVIVVNTGANNNLQGAIGVNIIPN